jgi:hypothetical protein
LSRYLIVGMPETPELILIDLEQGSVEKIAEDAFDASIAKARESGATVFRGVDVAIAVEDRTKTVGRFFFVGGSVR